MFLIPTLQTPPFVIMKINTIGVQAQEPFLLKPGKILTGFLAQKSKKVFLAHRYLITMQVIKQI